MSKTLFEKIVAREIPAQIVFEDDLVCAFRDIKPQAPTHVPDRPQETDPAPRRGEFGRSSGLGHLMLKTAEVARNLGLEKNRLPGLCTTRPRNDGSNPCRTDANLAMLPPGLWPVQVCKFERRCTNASRVARFFLQPQIPGDLRRFEHEMSKN